MARVLQKGVFFFNLGFFFLFGKLFCVWKTLNLKKKKKKRMSLMYHKFAVSYSEDRVHPDREVVTVLSRPDRPAAGRQCMILRTCTSFLLLLFLYFISLIFAFFFNFFFFLFGWKKKKILLLLSSFFLFFCVCCIPKCSLHPIRSGSSGIVEVFMRAPTNALTSVGTIEARARLTDASHAKNTAQFAHHPCWAPIYRSRHLFTITHS